MTPSEIGAAAEAAVAMVLLRSGIDVYVPLFRPHSRVDLVVVTAERLLRVQCKTSYRRGEVIVFRTCSNTGNVEQDYRGDVDAFGVWSPELEQAFLVPISEVATRRCHLRLGPAANGQRKGTRWAADYLVTPPSS